MKKDVKKLCIIGMTVSVILMAVIFVFRLIVAKEINWYSPTLLVPRIIQKSCFVALLMFLFYMQLDKLRKTAVFGLIKSYAIAQRLICLITVSFAEVEIVRSAIKTPTEGGALAEIAVLGLACLCIAISLENFKLREINVRSIKPMLFLIICSVIALICASGILLTWLNLDIFPF